MFAKIAFLRRLGVLVLLLALSSVSWATGKFFQSPQSYDSGGEGANSMAVADLNGDGKLDIVVGQEGASCGGGEVGVLLGNGDGTFQTAQTYCMDGGGYSSIFVADVNRDGRPDLIVAKGFFSGSDFDDGGVAVFIGNGDGTFQAAQSYKTGGGGAGAVFVVDLNGDGRPDLVVANCSEVGEVCQDPPYGNATGNVGVLLGNGDGTFRAAVNYDTEGSMAVFVVAVDVNRDGELDLVVANKCISAEFCGSGSIGILLGNGDGTFQPTVAHNWGGEIPFSMMVVDVNHDGKPDIVAGGFFVAGVSLGNGDGTFQDVVTYATGGWLVDGIALGDVDGDGVPDLVAGSRSGAYPHDKAGCVGVPRGNGDGTFQAPTVFTTDGFHAESIALADVNRDGRLDLLVTDLCAHQVHCSHGIAVVFLNASHFRTTTNLRSSLNPSKHGQAVTFTATVTPSGPDPLTGRVRFWMGRKAWGRET